MSSGPSSRVGSAERAVQKCATRILCLGNELLGDDSLGSVVARQLQQLVATEVQIVSSSESGLSLLDYLLDVNQLIVIDSVQTGNAPVGTIYQLREQDLKSAPGGSAHCVGLLDALALGRQLSLPVAEQVQILAVEITGDCTIGQMMHPDVAASLPALLELVRNAVGNNASWGLSTPLMDDNPQQKDGATVYMSK